MEPSRLNEYPNGRIKFIIRSLHPKSRNLRIANGYADSEEEVLKAKKKAALHCFISRNTRFLGKYNPKR